MPYEIGLDCIIKASEKEQDLVIWQMWLSLYPRMTKDTFVSYADYKNKLLKSSKPHKQTGEDMMAMCKILNAAFSGEVVET